MLQHEHVLILVLLAHCRELQPEKLSEIFFLLLITRPLKFIYFFIDIRSARKQAAIFQRLLSSPLKLVVDLHEVL